MTRSVEEYLIDGCGRCDLFATPQCKVRSWQKELIYLREILKQTELKEESKWGVPTYTWNGKNVIGLAALKDYVALSFFKGSLLKDPNNVLVKAGENSHIAKLLKFTDLQSIQDQKAQILAFIDEALANEKAGKKVESKAYESMVLPEELLQRFNEDPELKRAFEALTPGRQRGYVIFISGAKQSAIRLGRVDKHVDRIKAGKGMHDR